ncbi:MAG: hypothetical protein H7316_05645 [Tardiphaga sp.]|uniref:hypothetical protein n=1 Tax=Tardiphaga sp. TaxID=1926292 RepID=UPI00198ABC83|nr:hypothetical protein [Tardiphaga sp.]MBC7583216.1 hypothetical protein [Tardiphaga sp.]
MERRPSALASVDGRRRRRDGLCITWELFDVETMYVGLFVIAIIGFGMNAGFDAIERAVVPWRKR